VIVDPVRVAPRRVRLPDLDDRLRHRPAVLVEHPSVQDDPLTNRLARVLLREVGVLRPER
jgi:hypothetical protein